MPEKTCTIWNDVVSIIYEVLHDSSHCKIHRQSNSRRSSRRQCSSTLPGHIRQRELRGRIYIPVEVVRCSCLRVINDQHIARREGRQWRKTLKNLRKSICFSILVLHPLYSVSYKEPNVPPQKERANITFWYQPLPQDTFKHYGARLYSSWTTWSP